ncbi:hypothetical protein FN846DRAFT_458040 [Sphaerosporella brunnea]|uniref:Uncharacterized protein n=1 Tax=Sphaerosporella brunnea TaxID=1250544 RepID=A0A5J5F474_9PEZI|nr:hypothetical protein FN846DRAFT_458040 [Sphaerosporella brunnea]
MASRMTGRRFGSSLCLAPAFCGCEVLSLRLPGGIGRRRRTIVGSVMKVAMADVYFSNRQEIDEKHAVDARQLLHRPPTRHLRTRLEGEQEWFVNWILDSSTWSSCPATINQSANLAELVNGLEVINCSDEAYHETPEPLLEDTGGSAPLS